MHYSVFTSPENIPDGGPIRLACAYCDRDDFDGITEFPEDWEFICAVRGGSVAWNTHLGTCPDCEKGGRE